MNKTRLTLAALPPSVNAKPRRKSPCSVRPVEVRFWEKVDRSGDCWLWTAALNKKGYGKIWRWPDGEQQAHRFSWELVNGPIPAGMLVCHHCDTPSCVNPAHLFLGTAKDNTADMLAKKRHSHGASHGQKISAAPNRYHKLTPDDVRAIRQELKNGGTQRGVARMFGIGSRTVALIQHGVTWRHVDA